MDKKPNERAFDPKLKMAGLEILDILNKYDIAGVCIMQCITHTEYVMKIDPSYSTIALKNKVLDIKEPIDTGDPADRNRMIAQTMNMVTNLNMVAAKVSMSLMQARDAIMKRFDIKPPKVNIIIPGGKN